MSIDGHETQFVFDRYDIIDVKPKQDAMKKVERRATGKAAQQ
ncbi:MAG: hypothetical protein ACRD5K_13045 [Candidatus Acidiferrales bacterium]